MENCIDQANLGQVDTVIAKRYLLDQWAQIDIAAELGWTRATVSLHVSRIINKMENTARKLRLT
jgi:DNA-binding NarL/FixJ family response regulator